METIVSKITCLTPVEPKIDLCPYSSSVTSHQIIAQTIILQIVLFQESLSVWFWQHWSKFVQTLFWILHKMQTSSKVNITCSHWSHALEINSCSLVNFASVQPKCKAQPNKIQSKSTKCLLFIVTITSTLIIHLLIEIDVHPSVSMSKFYVHSWFPDHHFLVK